VLGQKFDEASVIGKDIHRPRFDLCAYPLMEVLALERDAQMLANVLTMCKARAAAGPHELSVLTRVGYLWPHTCVMKDAFWPAV